MGACSTGAHDSLRFEDVSEPVLAKLFLFLQDFFLLCFPFFVIAATSLGSTAPEYSFASTVESVSKSGIRIGDAIQDCEVWEEDDEEDDDDNEGDEESFTIRNNQPTAALIYGISL